MKQSLEWREHKIGYVSGQYAAVAVKGVNGRHLTERGELLYEARCNGLLVRLTPASLQTVKDACERHSQKANA